MEGGREYLPLWIPRPPMADSIRENPSNEVKGEARSYVFLFKGMGANAPIPPKNEKRKEVKKWSLEPSGAISP